MKLSAGKMVPSVKGLAAKPDKTRVQSLFDGGTKLGVYKLSPDLHVHSTTHGHAGCNTQTCRARWHDIRTCTAQHTDMHHMTHMHLVNK